jgi:adenosylhomocysteine nucleosidase
MISANVEWRAVLPHFPSIEPQQSPVGAWFACNLDVDGRAEPVVFFHGGWGKIAAAASAQYAIDRWQPALMVNLGTCGGFEGEIEPGDVMLVERTVVYDIIEMMGDPDEATAHFSTDIDLDWLAGEPPQPVRRGLLVSADRDLQVDDIPGLKAKYGATAGDWESGAIAWVAARNGVRSLILRAVTDLVGADGGEAYGNWSLFEARTHQVMGDMLRHLPAWLARAL